MGRNGSKGDKTVDAYCLSLVRIGRKHNSKTVLQQYFKYFRNEIKPGINELSFLS